MTKLLIMDDDDTFDFTTMVEVNVEPETLLAMGMFEIATRQVRFYVCWRPY